MQNHYISEWLNMPALQICEVRTLNANELHIDALPLDDRQSCPICECLQHVIRKGSNGTRTIRHLPAFEKQVYLHVPSIRMCCTYCQIGFSWAYSFVGPKQQYSHSFRAHAVEQALGSTAAHSARMQQAPVSTVQRMQDEISRPKRRAFTSKYGRRRRQASIWFWALMIFQLRKDIPTIRAFTICVAKRCWRCSLAVSWMICGPMPRSIRISGSLRPMRS